MTTASIPVFESIPLFVFTLKLHEMFFFFKDGGCKHVGQCKAVTFKFLYAYNDHII